MQKLGNDKMYAKEKKKADKKIFQWLRKNNQKDSKYFVFGVSDKTHYVINRLRKHNISVDYIIDNDSKKVNEYYSGIPVISFDNVVNLRKQYSERFVFFICSSFWREMNRQLKCANLPNIAISIINNQKNIILQKVVHVFQGKSAYKRIRKKYGKECHIFLCPYTGTGDIYLICSLLNQYVKINNIEDYVLVVVSNACRKVANLYNIAKVEKLKNTDMCSHLISYYMVEPDKCKIKVLNDSWGDIYTNQTQWIRGYKGNNFYEMFRKYVFDLPKDTLPEPPLLDNMSSEVQEFVSKNNLRKGKTIIISPYATTLADLPGTFWEKLVVRLIKLGYMVCTNIGSEYETAVENTTPIFFPLSIAPQVVEYAGYFVGVRSGLCDVISSSQAKKIILYGHTNWFYNCRAYEYFSLNKMKLCNDAVEIEFSGVSDSLVEEIIKNF